jgi:hypothetical protein
MLGVHVVAYSVGKRCIDVVPLLKQRVGAVDQQLTDVRFEILGGTTFLHRSLDEVVSVFHPTVRCRRAVYRKYRPEKRTFSHTLVSPCTLYTLVYKLHLQA